MFLKTLRAQNQWRQQNAMLRLCICHKIYLAMAQIRGATLGWAAVPLAVPPLWGKISLQRFKFSTARLIWPVLSPLVAVHCLPCTCIIGHLTTDTHSYSFPGRAYVRIHLLSRRIPCTTVFVTLRVKHILIPAFFLSFLSVLIRDLTSFYCEIVLILLQLLLHAGGPLLCTPNLQLHVKIINFLVVLFFSYDCCCCLIGNGYFCIGWGRMSQKQFWRQLFSRPSSLGSVNVTVLSFSSSCLWMCLCLVLLPCGWKMCF